MHRVREWLIEANVAEHHHDAGQKTCELFKPFFFLWQNVDLCRYFIVGILKRICFTPISQWGIKNMSKNPQDGDDVGSVDS